MQVRTNVAILYKGDRVGAGVEVEMDEKDVARLAGDVTPVDAIVAEEPEPEPDKALDKMSKDELAEKAESLGLKKTGTVADLVERITLHLEGAEEKE